MKSMKKAETERSKYALDWERIVFYVGRMTWRKGVEFLLWAWPEILKRHPEAKLVLAGKGPGLDHYKYLANRLGIGEKTYFLGFVPDRELWGLYKISDLSVIPSVYEPFGIVALESSAMKTPPVGSYTGGLKETIIHEKTGLHTIPMHSKSIADQVSRMLDAPDWAKKLGRNAGKFAREFSWSHVAKWTLGVYLKALS